MPRVEQLLEAENQLIGESIGRSERQRAIDLLPLGWCQAFAANARAEARRTMELRDKYQAELEGRRVALRDAVAKVRESYAPIASQPRMEGDVLSGDARVVFGPSTASMRTKDSITLEHAEVQPVRIHILWLERQIYACESALGQLRRMVKMADMGNVGLLTYMSAQWRAVLLTGPAVVDTLPRRVRGALKEERMPTDITGAPLPPEALAADGKTPELAPGMRGSTSSRGRAAARLAAGGD